MSKLEQARRAVEREDYAAAVQIYRSYLRDMGSEVSLLLAQSLELCISIYSRRIPEQPSSSRRDDDGDRPSAPVVLLVNPSHAHETEKTFWSDFARAMLSEGILVAEVNFRKVVPFTNVITQVWPARLADLSRAMIGYRDAAVPGWLSDELVDVYVDWEHRRWQIERYDARVREGALLLAKYIDEAITRIKPCAMITTNKIDIPNQFAYRAADFHGVVYRFVERSPFNTYLMEERGMFGESRLFENIVAALTEPSRQVDEDFEIAVAKALILENPYGFRADEAARLAGKGVADPHNKPLFFLPLDNILWTGWAQRNHPQRLCDYPFFENPEDALGEISALVHSLGGRLVIKPHPSCREWPRIKARLPSLEVIEGDLDLLCEQADVIVTFLTKVAYLALAKGKPVISFGAGLLDSFGVTYQVKALDELALVFRRALARQGLTEKVSVFDRLLPCLRRTYLATGGQAASAILGFVAPTATSPGQGLTDLSRKVAETLAAKTSASWASQFSSALLPAYGAGSTTVDIVFDVTRLMNPKLWLSGISRYVRATVDELSEVPGIRLVCAYLPVKVDHGLAAAHFAGVRDQLPVDLMPLGNALEAAEKSGRAYIYHSPINPFVTEPRLQLGRRVMTIHDVLHLTMPEFYPDGSAFTESVVKSIDPDRDWVVFDSDFSRQDYARYTNRSLSRTGVVHLGVSELFFRRHRVASRRVAELLPADSEIICFPFQGDPRKGFVRMLGVALRWAAETSSRRVCVFGKSSLAKELKRVLDGLPGNVCVDRVSFLAEPTDEELVELYRRSACHLYLSEAEGFGLPPLEAMAAGCPSVMIANTSLAEVYNGWELLMPLGASDEQIFAAVQTASVRTGENLRHRARAFAATYTWKRSVRTLLSSYAAALGDERLAVALQ